MRKFYKDEEEEKIINFKLLIAFHSYVINYFYLLYFDLL